MTASDSTFQKLSTGHVATLACLLEASVPKVGNVHRGADFEDTTFYDFGVSAVAIGNVFENADRFSVGEIVYKSVQATQRLVGTNTNLGMILLMAPLAKAESGNQDQLQVALDQLTEPDRDLVLQAICLASPGGLGKVESNDVRNPSLSGGLGLVEIMALAKDRDTIALQYANGFKDVFEFVVPTLVEQLDKDNSLPESIAHTQLEILARIPDTLIARKCGNAVANECSVRAKWIVSECRQGTDEYLAAVSDLDFWLRSDGHRRNPGTTADLLAAGIFEGIRSGKICPQKIQQALFRSRESHSE